MPAGRAPGTGGELTVDGARPSVAWVSSLPASWTTSRERLVLLVLACDAYESIATPGGAALASWCGLINGRLYETLGALTKATPTRPALLERVGRDGQPIPEGKRYGGRARTGYRLRVEVAPTLPLGRESAELSTSAGTVGEANSPEKLSRETLPDNSPGQPGDALPGSSLLNHHRTDVQTAREDDPAAVWGDLFQSIDNDLGAE